MRRRPARIAFFDAYALDAGAGIALRDLIERIDRDRFEPLALLPRRGPLVEMLQAVDCSVEIFEPPPLLGAFGRRLAQAGAVEMCRAAFALARYSADIARQLRSARIDLLHCNQTRAAFEAGPAGRIAGVPVVWNVRIREHLPRIVVHVCNECADLIIPLTDCDFAGLADEQALRSKSTVIRNAIDTQRFSSSSDRAEARQRLRVGEGALVLAAGVLVPRKGFDLAIEAMARLVQVLPEAKLLIAGREPDTAGGCRARLEALVAALDLQESVAFLGHCEDMPELLAACDIFVLPSRREGDPAVVLEAMASGRPVIATSAAAAAIEDGATGLVTPPNDVGALADAMAQLLCDPDRAQRMGQAARLAVETRHDIVAMVQRYEAAWESLLI